MKTQTRFIFFQIFFTALFFMCVRASFAANEAAPVVNSSDSSKSKQSDSANSTTLVIHKPAPDPAWGKVIQYQQEQTISNSDKTHETLHKFLFQDTQGIVRLATFHESASGNGYWEVWVWDQP